MQQSPWEDNGDGLPHDLCHLVVEDGLELSEGFWGLFDQLPVAPVGTSAVTAATVLRWRMAWR